MINYISIAFFCFISLLGRTQSIENYDCYDRHDISSIEKNSILCYVAYDFSDTLIQVCSNLKYLEINGGKREVLPKLPNLLEEIMIIAKSLKKVDILPNNRVRRMIVYSRISNSCNDWTSFDSLEYLFFAQVKYPVILKLPTKLDSLSFVIRKQRDMPKDVTNLQELNTLQIFSWRAIDVPFWLKQQKGLKNFSGKLNLNEENIEFVSKLNTIEGIEWSVNERVCPSNLKLLEKFDIVHIHTNSSRKKSLETVLSILNNVNLFSNG